MSSIFPRQLDGAREKLVRAEELIGVIDLEVSDLLRSGRYRVTGQHHHELREVSFTAFGPPLSSRFSVLAGEVVHHLRSSLDHLIWQLVISNGQVPNERNEFPICNSVEKFAQARQRGKIQGISATAEARIETFQPYHTAPIENNWLWVVHELDRIDKHRLLVVVLGVVGLGSGLGIGSDTGPLEVIGMTPPVRQSPTEEGVEVFRIFFGKYQPDVRVEPEFSFDLVIDRVGSVVRPHLISSLRAAHQSLSDAILSFSTEFPGVG